jgi:hypothetical protein
MYGTKKVDLGEKGSFKEHLGRMIASAKGFKAMR